MTGPRARKLRCAGITLVELLIALTLGLLIVLVGSTLLLSANSNYLNQSEAARLNDSGLYAHEIISRAIRQTAFIDWDSGAAQVTMQPEDSASISGLDARSVSRNSEGIDNPVNGAVNGSDVLAVRYFGTGTGAGGDGSVINCAGFGVPKAASEAERGWSIFYVATDADGEAELRCKYRGASSWGSDAIVRGVDTFQVLYGIDTDEPADGVANQYVNATRLDALDSALVLAGANEAERQADKSRKTYWKRVVSLKVALLLHGQRGSAGRALLPGRFDLFGKEYSDAYAGSDAGVRIEEAMMAPAMRDRVRHAVVWTILLRNRP